jgi:hypothetical protein
MFFLTRVGVLVIFSFRDLVPLIWRVISIYLPSSRNLSTLQSCIPSNSPPFTLYSTLTNVRLLPFQSNIHPTSRLAPIPKLPPGIFHMPLPPKPPPHKRKYQINSPPKPLLQILLLLTKYESKPTRLFAFSSPGFKNTPASRSFWERRFSFSESDRPGVDGR